MGSRGEIEAQNQQATPLLRVDEQARGHLGFLCVSESLHCFCRESTSRPRTGGKKLADVIDARNAVSCLFGEQPHCVVRWVTAVGLFNAER